MRDPLRYLQFSTSFVLLHGIPIRPLVSHSELGGWGTFLVIFPVTTFIVHAPQNPPSHSFTYRATPLAGISTRLPSRTPENFAGIPGRNHILTCDLIRRTGEPVHRRSRPPQRIYLANSIVDRTGVALPTQPCTAPELHHLRCPTLHRICFSDAAAKCTGAASPTPPCTAPDLLQPRRHAPDLLHLHRRALHRICLMDAAVHCARCYSLTPTTK